MRVGFVTNIRAPYRTLQFNEYTNIDKTKFKVYYTYSNSENRKWEIYNNIKFEEEDLDGFKIFKKYGYINKGIRRIFKENDIFLFGGYEQPTIIILSLLCRLYKKPYVIFFDGISCNRIKEKENKFKFLLKKLIIKNSSYVMANGEIGKKYFVEKFNYPQHKIYNQYLAVDNITLKELMKNKTELRCKYRKKFKIEADERVLLYSGRLVDIKNVDSAVKALSLIKDKKITLLITGGGEKEEEIKKLANELRVKVIITGFIDSQQELFKHYFAADVFILPSKIEPWGLVANEVMNIGLPVLISSNCGCAFDLVKCGFNGYELNPNNINDISKKINLMFNEDYKSKGKNSIKIISQWNFLNSKKQLEQIINKVI